MTQTGTVQHDRITADGIQLDVARAGPSDAPLVLLLHGFPESWYGWHRQIPALAGAGLRVWAPDQRGYGASDRPSRIEDYRLDALAADVVALIDAAGVTRASVVGHDWGALVAWWVAMHHPTRLDRMAVLNAPHPAVMRATLRRSPSQWLRSAYMILFQVPRLPEALASAGDWRATQEVMRRTSRPGTFSSEDMARYREAWAKPGAYTAMLNWYRALAQRPPGRSATAVRVTVPTMIIWGVEDAFLCASMARESVGWCDQGRLQLIEAGHWVQHEEAERVNGLLVEWLREAVPCPAP